ncbi:MAG: hypothetical protein LRS46_00375 [Desulfurococcales archaeon]|nr:hypothetical protein [Desulfurococcales archaeon]
MLDGATRIPRIVRDILEKRGFLFYYGEPSVGKTVLARLFIETLESLGFRHCYIATEPGSIADPSRIYVINLYNLLEAMFNCLSRGIAPVVDTLNSYYEGDIEGGRLLAFASALARSSNLPVIAVGQVRGEGVPWGWRWIKPWATHVARVRRLRPGVSIMEFEKPLRAIVAFKVAPLAGGGYAWI